MFDASWPEAALLLAALVGLAGLAWAVVVRIRRLLTARRCPRGWDEHVLGYDSDRPPG